MSRPVNVIPSREARAHLGTMLSRFRDGDTEPMYFGAHRKPEAAVIPFERYMELLDLEERWASEDRFAAEVQSRIERANADPASSVQMSLEDLADQLGPHVARMLEDVKAETNDVDDVAGLPHAAHG